jgi:hypothetical protein
MISNRFKKFFNWIYTGNFSKHLIGGIIIGIIAILIDTLLGHLICAITTILLLKYKEILYRNSCEWPNCCITTIGGFLGGILISLVLIFML